MKILLLYLFLCSAVFAASPWEPYDGQGKGKKQPIPEPATYGLILVGAASAFVIYRKIKDYGQK